MSEPVTVHHTHRMPFGAEARGDGTMRFRLWAPAAETVELYGLGPPAEGWDVLPPWIVGWFLRERDA